MKLDWNSIKNMKAKQRSPKRRCDHDWCYEHCIWQAKPNEQNSVAIGRYCTNCGRLETATPDKWRPLPKSYVDMRACLSKNLNVLHKPGETIKSPLD